VVGPHIGKAAAFAPDRGAHSIDDNRFSYHEVTFSPEPATFCPSWY
jgi:hypothetical protein